MFIPTKKGMYIRETTTVIGRKKIIAQLQVRHSQVHDHRSRTINLLRDQVPSQARDHRNQVQGQVHSLLRDRVLSQARDLQLVRATSYSATTKTEAREIQIIITIRIADQLLQITEVINQGLNQDLNQGLSQDLAVAEVEEEGSKICFF